MSTGRGRRGSETGEETLLAAGAGESRPIPQGFGPEGRYLYYTTDRNSEFRYVARYDVETGGHETVLQPDWDVMNVSLSPTGRYIAVAVNADARTEAHILETGTLEPVPLPTLPVGDISGVAFSQDERRLAFGVGSGREPNDLWALDLDGGEPRPLVRTVSPGIDPELARAGHEHPCRTIMRWSGEEAEQTSPRMNMRVRHPAARHIVEWSASGRSCPMRIPCPHAALPGRHGHAVRPRPRREPRRAMIIPRAPPPLKLGLVVLLCAACTRSTPVRGTLDAEPGDVGYLWLEDLRSDSVLRWAEARRMQTLEHFSALPIYDSLLAEIRSARVASRVVPLGNVPPPHMLTGRFANVFGDRGWGRQPADGAEAGANAWEMVLDLDSLSRADGGRYRLGPESLECLPPEYERCLLLLSRDGRSSRGLREFDAGRRAFVTDGFNAPEARTSAFWRDLNSVYITKPEIGCCRTEKARIWSRGRSLDDARVIFTAGPSDRGVSFERKGTRLLLLHSYDRYDIDYYLVRDDELVQLPVPRDIREVAFIDGRMVLQLRSGWKPSEVAFPSGSLIGIDLQDFLEGSRDFDLIMSSDRDLVVDVIWTTRSLVLVRALADMKVRLFEFSNRGGTWERRRIDVPEDGEVRVRNFSAESDTYYFTHEDFLSPRTFYRRSESGEVQAGARTTPAFSADPYEVSRRHATSADGTRIPYFIVHREDMPLDGGNPVIVHGYGGNGISILPDYLSLHGPTWLSRGGVYVLANIRGGNEYGPDWHAAVRREKRQRAYDDFQAVAQDLVDRKVTSPKMVGAYGASNGGILVGMSFIQRPDLYGAVWSNNGVLELQRCSGGGPGGGAVAERGDGQDPDDWAYMRHYSPFHNLVEGEPYPPLLLFSNRADDVVHPCHSRKFTAQLEDLGYEDVFHYETESGGHRKSYGPEEEAMIMSFFLTSLHPDYR